MEPPVGASAACGAGAAGWSAGRSGHGSMAMAMGLPPVSIHSWMVFLRENPVRMDDDFKIF